MHGTAEKAKLDLQVPTFERFRESFGKMIKSPHFGEKDSLSVAPGEKSAGRKELERSSADVVLDSSAFLRFAYRSILKYLQLRETRPEVRKVASTSGKRIRRIRDFQMSLRRIVSTLTSLDKRADTVLTFESRMHFDKALNELQALQDVLLGIEEYWTSQIHPELREKHDTAVPRLAFKRSKWRSQLDPPHGYELDSLKKKAPLQWLIPSLDAGLKQRFQRSHVKVSKTGRRKVISAVLTAGGLPSLSPQTIRTYFRDPQKA